MVSEDTTTRGRDLQVADAVRRYLDPLVLDDLGEARASAAIALAESLDQAVAGETGDFFHRLHGVRVHLTRHDVRARMWSHYEFSLATVTVFIGTPSRGAIREITWPARGAVV